MGSPERNISAEQNNKVGGFGSGFDNFRIEQELPVFSVQTYSVSVPPLRESSMSWNLEELYVLYSWGAVCFVMRRSKLVRRQCAIGVGRQALQQLLLKSFQDLKMGIANWLRTESRTFIEQNEVFIIVWNIRWILKIVTREMWNKNAGAIAAYEIGCR